MAAYEDLEKIYAWIDEIPLSRTKKNLTRDFSDGVLMAEVCKHIFPKFVDLHNYPVANSLSAKVINWETLNRKVFSKLQMRVTQDLMQQIAVGVPGALESVLLAVKQKADERQKQNDLSHSTNSSRISRGELGDYTSSDALLSEVGILSEIKKLKSEVQLKNDTIAILNQKVVHLESLLEMKDKRLRELASSVHRLQTQVQASNSQDSFRTIST